MTGKPSSPSPTSGGGLVAKEGALTGFTIAGHDKKFFHANAVMDGDCVIVSSPDVPTPVAVRYGWANLPTPTINLWNKANFPASPFRSDDWIAGASEGSPQQPGDTP